MLTLANPWVLILIPLPFLIRMLIPAYQGSRPALQSTFLDRLTELTGRKPSSGAVERPRSFMGGLVLAVVWACLVVSLARPQRFETLWCRQNRRGTCCWPLTSPVPWTRQT